MGRIKGALSDEKIKQAVQLFASREVEKYKEMLDGHWLRMDSMLGHLLQRIPYSYDINKRLVRACVWLSVTVGLSVVGNIWQAVNDRKYRENDWKYRYMQALWRGEVPLINNLDRAFDQGENENIGIVKQEVVNTRRG